jgi:hypothetical protein
MVVSSYISPKARKGDPSAIEGRDQAAVITDAVGRSTLVHAAIIPDTGSGRLRLRAT